VHVTAAVPVTVTGGVVPHAAVVVVSAELVVHVHDRHGDFDVDVTVAVNVTAVSMHEAPRENAGREEEPRGEQDESLHRCTP
jgi:hypothetical protein